MTNPKHGEMTDVLGKLRDPEFPQKPAGTMALRLSAADAIERLMKRLELDHYYVGPDMTRIDGDPEYDGIDARDATIDLLESRIETLTAERPVIEKRARQEGWKAGMEEAAVLMETHVCDLTATKEAYGVLPMVPLNWKTPGMQSRAAFIRSKITDSKPTPCRGED